MSFAEKLCSNTTFNFTPVQNDLWEAVQREELLAHQELLRSLVAEFAKDEDQVRLFFEGMFNKMHLNLSNIRLEKFRNAVNQIEDLKTLLEFKEAQIVFTQSQFFLPDNLQHFSGKQIQHETYLGRYLSFSCLSSETRSFKDAYFKNLSRSSQTSVQKMTDGVAD